MIINIRGTSGSGKTHSVRSFMNAHQPESIIYMENGRVAAHCVYYNMMPVYVIGSYANVCGGCDAIPTQDIACSLVRHFSNFGHVLFEGLLMSHLYARYYALYKELTDCGEKFIFAFMDTPLDVSLERVQQRRLEKGNTKPFNPQNTISHHESTLITRDKFKLAGCEVRWLRHQKDPVAQISKWLDLDTDLQFSASYREESFR